jgi:hypothetical protein
MFNRLSATDIATLTAKTITTGTPVNVTAASKANPAAITATAHGLITGDFALVAAVGGNTTVNGVWKVTKVDANGVTLTGCDATAAGTYTSGGTIAKLTVTKFAADLTVENLRQLDDATNRMKRDPLNKLSAQFPAGVQP